VEAPFLWGAKIVGKSEEKKCEAKAEKNVRRRYRSVELDAKVKGVVPGRGVPERYEGFDARVE